jgi:hypothetical protein
VSHYLFHVTRRDDLWKIISSIELGKGEVEENLITWNGKWREFYKCMRGWQWNWPLEQQLKWLEVTNRRRSVKRYADGGNNTAIQTTKPFTLERNSFLVQIDEMGSWFAIGFSEIGFTLENGSLVGVSSSPLNVGYGLWGGVSEGGSHGKTRIETNIHLTKMKAGDLIRFTMWSDGLGFQLMLNEVEIAKIFMKEPIQIALFPTLSLSSYTKVTILNRPPKDLPKLESLGHEINM